MVPASSGYDGRMRTRTATVADEKAITRLIALSSRILAAGDYTTEQIEQALRGAWGLDSQLIKGQTCLLVEYQGEALMCKQCRPPYT